MLDTDIVSYALRGYGRVRENIVKHRPTEICISVITLAELRYGATARKSQKIHRLIDAITADLAVMPFDEVCATRYGEVGGELAARGTIIGAFDVMLAAQALVLQVTLVTNNVKHFTPVRRLRIENWT